jgi:hypothetical protein
VPALAKTQVEWDLSINDTHPEGCTSADATGLPLFPGLARYDEMVTNAGLRHALRFTASRTRRAYIASASHYTSSNIDPDLPPMELRVRMKADYNRSGYAGFALGSHQRWSAAPARVRTTRATGHATHSPSLRALRSAGTESTRPARGRQLQPGALPHSCSSTH